MGLSFWTISKHHRLIGELEIHASIMYFNISQITSGPNFGQQKHKIIDTCKRDFNITFPVHPL